MFQKLYITLCLLFIFLFSFSLQASTQSHQFQLGTGAGVFVGSGQIDPSFDFALEPEFFITDHMSASLRFDVTAGGVDTIHLGGRFRYYFNLSDRLDFYAGLGIGGIINLESGNGTGLSHNGYGDLALPVLGIQYDLTKHIKMGAEASVDLVFRDHVNFATRLMPIQFKWAF